MKITQINDNYQSYLMDESKIKGQAESISFPSCKDELLSIIANMKETKTPITIQGGKTGICGGATPSSGHILNLEKMTKALLIEKDNDDFLITLEAGVKISDLNNNFKTLNTDFTVEEAKVFADMRKQNDYVFLPQPTETSATIGGVISVNAKGINQSFIDDTRKYVEAIDVALPNGKSITINRGEYFVNDGKCKICGTLALEFNAKNMQIIGSQIKRNMDLIDLFIGSEGIFGCIISAKIRLVKNFKNLWSVMFFFREENSGVKFATEIIQRKNELFNDCNMIALEYFNNNCLKGIHKFKQKASKLATIPDIDEDCKDAIYIEIAGENDNVENALVSLLEIFANYNSNEMDSWAGSGNLEAEKFKLFRHAAAEFVNETIDMLKINCKELHKIACDFTVSQKSIMETIQMYQDESSALNLETVVFGHIFDNHLHVNIIPKNIKEMEIGEKLVFEWSKKVLEANGKIISENGIGKIKREMVNSLASDCIETIKSIKSQLDEDNLFGRGNIV